MNGVQDVLAGVLAEHQWVEHWSGSPWLTLSWQCLCGHRPDRGDHRAHVAAEQVKALREWAQQDETVEVGIYVFVNEGLIPEDMSYAEVVGTVLTAVFGSSA